VSPYQLAVEVHRLEAWQNFWIDAPGPPQGPVVVTTPRGQELGWIRQIQPLAHKPFPACRAATPEDLRQSQVCQQFAAEVEVFARHQVKLLGLNMLLLGAHQVLSGERVVLYFRSEQRVDFRALVKVLAENYRKKIELVQLNAREQAQQHGAQGRCGRECCCTAWLQEFPSVSVRLAEAQGFQLQPEAITGVCGRLLCCLRYEYEGYLEGRQNPQVGDVVDTPEGLATILAVDPHSRTLTVKLSQGQEALIPFGRARNHESCRSCQKGTEEPML